MQTIKSYKNIIVWQKGYEFVEVIKMLHVMINKLEPRN